MNEIYCFVPSVFCKENIAVPMSYDILTIKNDRRKAMYKRCSRYSVKNVVGSFIRAYELGFVMRSSEKDARYYLIAPNKEAACAFNRFLLYDKNH